MAWLRSVNIAHAPKHDPARPQTAHLTDIPTASPNPIHPNDNKFSEMRDRVSETPSGHVSLHTPGSTLEKTKAGTQPATTYKVRRINKRTKRRRRHDNHDPARLQTAHLTATLEHHGFLTQWNANNLEKVRDSNHPLWKITSPHQSPPTLPRLRQHLQRQFPQFRQPFPALRSDETVQTNTSHRYPHYLPKSNPSKPTRIFRNEGPSSRISKPHPQRTIIN